MSDKPVLLVMGASSMAEQHRLESAFSLHVIRGAADLDAIPAHLADRVVAMSVSYSTLALKQRIDAPFMQRFPRLRLVASFGVGYDHVDAAWAGTHGVIVTNTPDVLNEEVADFALGLLLCTVRELPQAMRHLQDGKWSQGAYRLSPATLRDRTVGLVGMGRIGRAIAHRVASFGVPVVYHSRRPAEGVSYRHYPGLLEMAEAVDTLIVIVPGGDGTRHLIDAAVLKALGSRGILINVARGSVVDERALVSALRGREILAAGLDVFADEPNVPPELVAMQNVVLLPHIGSASEHTRAAMRKLVVDNLMAWAAGRGPLTPVPETPVAMTPR